MKLEKGSFTPVSSSHTLILNDSSLEPDVILFWMDGSPKFHGFDNTIEQVAAYGSGTSVKDDRSIYVHNGSNVVMSGRVDYFDVGEVEIDFDVFTASQIEFLAIEY